MFLKIILVFIVIILVLQRGVGFVESVNEQEARHFDERLNVVILANLHTIYGGPNQQLVCYGIWRELYHRLRDELDTSTGAQVSSSSDQNAPSSSRSFLDRPLLSIISYKLLEEVKDWAAWRLEKSKSDDERKLMEDVMCLMESCAPILRQLGAEPTSSTSSSSDENYNLQFSDSQSSTGGVEGADDAAEQPLYPYMGAIETILNRGNVDELDELLEELDLDKRDLNHVINQQRKLLKKAKSDMSSIMEREKLKIESKEKSSKLFLSPRRLTKAEKTLNKNEETLKSCKDISQRALQRIKSINSSASSSSTGAPRLGSRSYDSSPGYLGSGGDHSSGSESDESNNQSERIVNQDLVNELNNCQRQLLEFETNSAEAHFELDSKIRKTVRSLKECEKELEQIIRTTLKGVERFNSMVDDDLRI